MVSREKNGTKLLLQAKDLVVLKMRPKKSSDPADLTLIPIMECTEALDKIIEALHSISVKSTTDDEVGHILGIWIHSKTA